MLVYDTAKIAPRLDTRHVHEHRVLAKIPGEIIEQAARLTFGVPELLDGIDTVVVAVGLFAIGETLYMAATDGGKADSLHKMARM